MNKIDVSIIVTVFNKAYFLPTTIKSLLNQQSTAKAEIIFVDDCSTDNSLEVIKKHTQKANNIRIIQNTDNKGPSIRTNQGALAARGEYLHFIDGDDIMPTKCSEILLKIMKSRSLDFIYGRYKKTNKSTSELLKTKLVLDDTKINDSNSPLLIIQTGGFARMNLMVKRKIFVKSGGCDEKVFIQDESLPIRLAAASSKAAMYEENIAYVPSVNEENLSNNKPQQNHDRFFAYYNFYNEFPEQAKSIERYIYQKMVGAYWKYLRDHHIYKALSTKAFWWYLSSKLSSSKINKRIIKIILNFFSLIENVRKISNCKHD